MSDKKLAFTIHHKGRRYDAGLTAEEVGPVAGEFGDHVWEGGKAPVKADLPSEHVPDGGSYTATPGPSRSALPGPDTSGDVATATRTEGGDNTPGTPGDEVAGDGDTGSTPKRATSRRSSTGS